MKVVGVCMQDWNNYGYDTVRALRSVGVDADCYKLEKSVYEYEKEAKILDYDGMLYRAKEADVIIFFHACYTIFCQYKPWFANKKSKKKIIAHYSGAKIEENILKDFNHYASASVVSSESFLNHGVENEIYIPHGVDTDGLRPTYLVKKDGEPLYIGFVGGPGEKYPDALQEIFGENYSPKMELKINDWPKNWVAHVKNIVPLDIVVTRQPCSIRSLEAASMGKVIISPLNKVLYSEHYGPGCAILPANSRLELETQISNLIEVKPDTINVLKEVHRTWVHKHHSLEATGVRWRALALKE